MERDASAGRWIRPRVGGETYEKGESQSFYNEFFEIFGVRRRTVARYEEHVRRLDDTSGFIDLFWPGVLLVEQKSAGRDLAAAREQAGTYFDALPERDRPRYQLLCDFQTFELLDRSEREETRFALADLPRHVEKFGFILGVQQRTFRDQDPVNIEASELVARLHDALKASGYEGHDLQLFLVRTVFCLFADDTGIFEPRDLFLQFIEERTSASGADLGPWLARVFQVLNTPPERRQKALDEDLSHFPHVNGDLFAEPLLIPDFDAAMREALLEAGPLRLDRHLAGDFRRAVPVGDGTGGAPCSGSALHDREEHPEGDRAAVPRCAPGGIRSAKGASGRPQPDRPAQVLEPARLDPLL